MPKILKRNGIPVPASGGRKDFFRIDSKSRVHKLVENKKVLVDLSNAEQDEYINKFTKKQRKAPSFNYGDISVEIREDTS